MKKLVEPGTRPPEVERFRNECRDYSRRKPSTPCRNCGATQWQCHQSRGRWFLIVLWAIVHPSFCALYRWRCGKCGKTCTHYPPLCLPYKLYLREQVEGRCGRYVREARTSYRAVVREQGMAVVHAGAVAGPTATEREKEAEPTVQLAPSSVYRWIDAMARMARRQSGVLKRAREAGVRLGGWLIAPWKYRSAKRRGVLTQCRMWLEALAGLSNFTEVATGGPGS